jgi:hypothetical protein
VPGLKLKKKKKTKPKNDIIKGVCFQNAKEVRETEGKKEGRREVGGERFLVKQTEIELFCNNFTNEDTHYKLSY